jgi:hypothetical protein
MPHHGRVLAELGLQRLTQPGQVQMTDDPPELPWPGPSRPRTSAGPSSRHRLTFLAWSRQTEIIDSIASVERNVLASIGGTSSRSTVSVSDRPS